MDRTYISRKFWLLRAFVFFVAMLSSILSFASTETKPGLDTPYPSAEALLLNFGKAVRELSYEGVFTYEYAGKLETFGLVHVVEEGIEREFIYRTNGPEQAFKREIQLGCSTIGGKLLLGRQLTSAKGDVFGLKHFYRAVFVGSDRIAGRDVWVIRFVPLDEFRYGISLAFDKSNHLLLQYIVLDEQKKSALERMQFASIKLIDDVPAFLTEQNEFAEQSVLAKAMEPNRCVGETYSPLGNSPWKPSWIPPGFILTEYSYSDSEGHMETYTDGLHSFSIFVKEAALASNDDRSVHQGVSSKGAVTALLSLVPFREKRLAVSIVGEIPPRVAQRVTLSLTQVQSANHTEVESSAVTSQRETALEASSAEETEAEEASAN